jgi:hypothetical protein
VNTFLRKALNRGWLVAEGSPSSSMEGQLFPCV